MLRQGSSRAPSVSPCSPPLSRSPSSAPLPSTHRLIPVCVYRVRRVRRPAGLHRPAGLPRRRPHRCAPQPCTHTTQPLLSLSVGRSVCCRSDPRVDGYRAVRCCRRHAAESTRVILLTRPPDQLPWENAAASENQALVHTRRQPVGRIRASILAGTLQNAQGVLAKYPRAGACEGTGPRQLAGETAGNGRTRAFPPGDLAIRSTSVPRAPGP